MTGHGGQPFQQVVGFLLLPILGSVDDRGLVGGVVHTFLGEGGPHQIGGQVFQGFLLPRLDTFAGKDVEPGVPPAVEHAGKFRGDFPLAQEHGELLHVEEPLHVLHVELRSHPEQALPIEAAIGCQDVQMWVKAVRTIPKGLCGHYRGGDRLGFRHCGLQEDFQSFPGAATQLNQQPAIMEEEVAEDFGDRENPMPVRDGPEDMSAKPLAELHGPFLSTTWAELSLLATEREDPFRPAGVAADAGKTFMIQKP